MTIGPGMDAEFDRDFLDGENDELHERIAQLKRENADLRAALASLDAPGRALEGENVSDLDSASPMRKESLVSHNAAARASPLQTPRVNALTRAHYNSSCADSAGMGTEIPCEEAYAEVVALAKQLEQGDFSLPADVLKMCASRGWSMHWTHRGAYLHLESSELIEAIRGKHGDPLKEAADVLLVLMSITEYAGIPWGKVLVQARNKCDFLLEAPHYPGEEYSPDAAASPESAQDALNKTEP